MIETILFVIVLYNSDYYKCNTYKTLISSQQNPNVFICDNSRNAQLIQEPNIKYSHHPENPGLSFAYNEAAKYAQEKGYQWMLLLDQDTCFPDRILESYIHGIKSNQDIKLLAPPVCVGSGRYMSPIKLCWKFGSLSKNAPRNQIVSLHDYSPINSGICVSVDYFFKAGGYKNEVFLDYSDFQFIERLRKVSDKCFILDTEIHQEFSALVDDKDKALGRYALFCKSLKHCDKNNMVDSLGYALVVIKRCISLVVKTKSTQPFFVLYKNYFSTSKI